MSPDNLGDRAMRVGILSPYPSEIGHAIASAGDEIAFQTADKLQDGMTADIAVSFGYRHIIREPWLSRVSGGIINVHTSLLPWNRGADPNFWSWFDDTPKGVSLHLMDAGIDTGPVLIRHLVSMSGGETLRSSYAILRREAVHLFNAAWREIREQKLPPIRLNDFGTVHTSTDKEMYWSLFPDGYDTKCGTVTEIGQSITAEEQMTAACFDKFSSEIDQLRVPGAKQ